LTANQKFLWSHTIRQLERGVDALHDDHLLSGEIGLYLRDKSFQTYFWSQRLDTPAKSFTIFLKIIKNIWRQQFPRGTVFRSTGVTLLRLSRDAGTQFSLFEDPGLVIRQDELERAKHDIKDKYGNLAIRSASSLRLPKLGPNRKKEMKTKAFNVDW